MKSLNGEDMVRMLDGVSASLLLAHKVTEEDLNTKPEIKEGILSILSAMVSLDQVVLTSKLKEYTTPENSSVGRLVRKNDVSFMIYDGGKTSSTV